MRHVSVHSGGLSPVVSIESGGHRQRVLARRDALVVEHLDLVPPIARQAARNLPPSFDLEDLISVGQFGLIRAATRYRPERHGGTPFPAFARPRIHGAIIDSVRRRNWHENTREAIPENFEIPFVDPFEAETVVSIDETRSMRYSRGNLRKPVHVALNRLTARQRILLGAYYAENCESVEDAGAALGMNPAAVRREHDAAIGELRRIMRVKM